MLRSHKILFPGAFFIFGFVSSFLFARWFYALADSGVNSDNRVRTNDRENRFTNPLLECDAGESLTQSLKPFKKNIEATIDRLKKEKKITFAGYYFRDLNNGPWFGINFTEGFIPASLMKLPILIGFYKESEKDPSILKKKLTIKQHSEYIGYFKNKDILKVGQEYTVEQLLDHMIRYSDNDAATVLMENGGEKFFNKTLDELGLNSTEVESFGKISVRSYSSFFRVLFNASYLSANDSEKVMSILNQTEFRGGLVAGLPHDVQIAHKFGERWPSDGTNEEKQLHDCGIIYYSNHPYLLCIMTRGDEFGNIAHGIAELSAETYKQVSRQY